MPSYTVKSGDTLSDIARKQGLPLDALVSANPQFTNPNRIKPGDVVKLPYFPPGEAKTEFDPSTPPAWKSPFSMFPTPESGSTGSWNPMLKPPAGGPDPAEMPAMPSPLASDATATAEVSPLEKASREARERIIAQPRAAAEWFIDFGKRVKKAMDGGMAMEDLIKLGVDTSLLTVGGGGAAAKVGGTASKTAKPMPLPEGELRHLPSGTKATGRVGVAQSLFGSPSKMQRFEEMGGMGAVDPMWIDTVMHGRPPTGNFRGEFRQPEGTVLGSNVIPFDPKAKKLTDPKTNLERRMARRGEGNQVLPQSRWDQAQVGRYAKEASEARPKPENIASGLRQEVEKNKKLRTEVNKLTPAQWSRLDPRSREVLIKQGIYPQSAAPKPLTSNSPREEFQARLDALMEKLKPGKYPDDIEFP